MSERWTAATRAAIGADWLEAAIAPAAEFGRRHRAAHGPYGPGDEAVARAEIARVHEVALRVEAATLEAMHAAFATCPDPSATLARSRAGEVLAEADFFDLARFVDAVAQIRALARDRAFAEIGLPAQSEALLGALAPGRTPGRSFYLDDAFDPALGQARAAAAARQAMYDVRRGAVQARVARYAGLESVRDGEFILMRESVRGPLPSEVRVLREAATYVLCEIALDEEALAALAALEDANRAVADAEERVRARLSTAVRDAAPSIDGAMAALGALDAFTARVRFAQRHATCLPEIVEQAGLAFVEARYLPLLDTLAEHGRSYEPISLQLDAIGVITGPNMGGKTAALRTCGLLAACVALGVPVPARSARLALFDEVVWIGIGAAPEGNSLLSAFGAEVVDLQGFLTRGAARALALIDEFARTTTPHEGRALLVALLERLRERGACALAATHQERVAAGAGVVHYAIGRLREPLAPAATGPLDLETALARIARSRDYRITRVDEDAVSQADAVELAAALGLDRRLVELARRQLMKPAL